MCWTATVSGSLQGSWRTQNAASNFSRERICAHPRAVCEYVYVYVYVCVCVCMCVYVCVRAFLPLPPSLSPPPPPSLFVGKVWGRGRLEPLAAPVPPSLFSLPCVQTWLPRLRDTSLGDAEIGVLCNSLLQQNALESLECVHTGQGSERRGGGKGRGGGMTIKAVRLTKEGCNTRTHTHTHTHMRVLACLQCKRQSADGSWSIATRASLV